MVDKELVAELSGRISTAFRLLRKQGFIAKAMNQNSISTSLATIPAGTTDYVFYHTQDARDMQQHGYCQLTWAGRSGLIWQIMESAGLMVQLVGDKNERILVRLPDEEAVEEAIKKRAEELVVSIRKRGYNICLEQPAGFCDGSLMVSLDDYSIEFPMSWKDALICLQFLDKFLARTQRS